MFNGFEKLIGVLALPSIWIASIEVRLRNKVDKGLFDMLQDQINRIEDYQHEMMTEIKNNRK